MVEFCSKKRLVIAIAVVLCLTVVITLIENHFTEGLRKIWPTAEGTDDNSTGSAEKLGCWHQEPFVLIANCTACTDFEKKVGHRSFCLPSGWYDKVNCTHSGQIGYRSCTRVHWLEERNFMLTYVGTLVGAMVTTSMVILRQKYLDRIAFNKIQQRLGESSSL